MKIERAFIARDMNAIQSAFDAAADLLDEAFVMGGDARWARASTLRLALFDLAEKHLTAAEIDTLDFSGTDIAELNERRNEHISEMERRAARANEYTFVGF